MTDRDLAEDDVRKWFARFFTFDRGLMIVSMTFAAGMWWKTQNVRDLVIQEQFDRDNARLIKLEQINELREKDLVADRLDVKVSRAEVTVRLAQIALDINSMREEVKGLQGEVRKIR